MSKSSLSTVQIPKKLSQKVSALAVIEKRSIRKEIEYIIERYIAEHEKMHGEIEIKQEDS